MAAEQDRLGFLKSIAFWQYFTVVATGLGLTLLVRYHVWPFETSPPELGEQPSVFEILANDRILIGFVRIGIIAIVSYVIVSVPALVLARRWMKGLSTTGLTADDAQEADFTIEELQTELQDTDDAYQEELRRADLASQLLLEQLREMWDDSQEDGEEEDT